MVYWQSEHLPKQTSNEYLSVGSANLVDFIVSLASQLSNIKLVALQTDAIGRVEIARPDNFIVRSICTQMPNNLATLKLAVCIGKLMLCKEYRDLASSMDISVSVGYSGFGSIAALLRILYSKKSHVYIVRGNRLATLKDSSRGFINKYIAIFRVRSYRAFMIFAVKKRRAEIWFQGQAELENFIIEYPKIDQTRLKLLNAVLRELPTNNAKPIILCELVYSGRLTIEKGLRELLYAVKKLNDSSELPVRLCLLGDGPDKQQLIDLALKLEIESVVTFLGFVSDTRVIANHIRSARLFVLPSYTEGLPRSMVESMALGTPVLVTPVGGIPYVIKPEINGFIVKAGDSNDLAVKVDYILNELDDATLGEIVEKARNTASKYTFENRGKVFLESIIQVDSNASSN